MAQNLQRFNFKGNQVTTITDGNGNPWWVANEVCKILGYSNTRDAVAKHLKSCHKNAVAIRDAMGREQMTTIISESGLYRLIMRSKMPEAEAFQEWVTSDVIPSIRKTGEYRLKGQTHQEQALFLAEQLLEQRDKVLHRLDPDEKMTLCITEGQRCEPERYN